VSGERGAFCRREYMSDVKPSLALVVAVYKRVDDVLVGSSSSELPSLNPIRMNLSNDITATTHHSASPRLTLCAWRAAQGEYCCEYGKYNRGSEGEKIRHVHKTVELSMLRLCHRSAYLGSFWMAVRMLCPLALRPPKIALLFGRTQQDPARRVDFD
jgi:hypothetical protein